MNQKNLPGYQSWAAMKRRCYETTNKDYARWGGRGIGVCDRWRFSFHDFIADMGAPQPGQSIDRIDNDKNYEPGNCRWATAKQQARNTRGTRSVSIAGLDFETMGDACAHFGISQTTVGERLKAGYDLETSLTTPKGKLPWIPRPTGNRTRDEKGRFE